MDELVFKYFLISSFFISVFKSTMRGFTSEIISFFFALVGFFSAVAIYKPNLKYLLVALSLFAIIYLFGLFLAFKNRRGGLLERLFGFAIGIVKFASFLVILSAIAMIVELTPPCFTNNVFIQELMPYSLMFKTFLLNHVAYLKV